MSESNIPQQCTSLYSNLEMRPEFIRLCGVREAGGVGWGDQYTVDKEGSRESGQWLRQRHNELRHTAQQLLMSTPAG
jgi:hypothetical protein